MRKAREKIATKLNGEPSKEQTLVAVPRVRTRAQVDRYDAVSNGCVPAWRGNETGKAQSGAASGGFMDSERTPSDGSIEATSIPREARCRTAGREGRSEERGRLTRHLAEATIRRASDTPGASGIPGKRRSSGWPEPGRIDRD